ncbi:hypothetical protein ACOKXR_11830, partial [Glutamicibacter creatinolyticus]
RTRREDTSGNPRAAEGADRHGHSKGKQDRPAREAERHRETRDANQEEGRTDPRRRRTRRRTRSQDSAPRQDD